MGEDTEFHDQSKEAEIEALSTTLAKKIKGAITSDVAIDFHKESPDIDEIVNHDRYVTLRSVDGTVFV